MWSSGFSIAAGFSALLLLACVLDVSTALRLSLIERSDRNSYVVRCEDDMGDPAPDATLTLNTTTPPSDCLIVTAHSNNQMRLNFTISCEGTALILFVTYQVVCLLQNVSEVCHYKIGFLQCKDGDSLSLPTRELEGKDSHTYM